MRQLSTDYGTLQIGPLDETFQAIVAILRTATAASSAPVSVGLSGGSTPKAFYQWAIREKTLPESVWTKCLWLTSDERCVPLTSDDSNFGNADRLLLTPLGVPPTAKLPWPVALPPADCAASFQTMWNARFGAQRGFDVCFLGMGDDGHTASLFPGCPLIGSGLTDNFAAVEWPGRGWRLTITEAGLARCAHIVVITNGAAKAGVLKEILRGPYDPKKLPSQIHRAYAPRVTWLVDEAAAGSL
ncbi:MAG TPA: 6-phosphogluconolactonase [Opitutales bacterium]|jgi:6-phosphogluconolactonase|nr:6-phosphogluconolactonase [Opitutales bacterium]